MVGRGERSDTEAPAGVILETSNEKNRSSVHTE